MPKLSYVLLTRDHAFKKFTYHKSLGYKCKIVLPPVLRNSVSNKSDKTKTAHCAEQMSVLMGCWKQNDFNQQACSQELANFQNCVVAAQAAEKAALEALKQGKTVIKGRYPSSKVNEMLKRYPQPPVSIKLQ